MRLASSTFAVHRLVPGILRLILALALGLIACFAPYQSGARSVSWPAFGPDEGLLRLDGFTDTLPDFVGPIDGSAELTIFTEGNHYPVLLPLVLASPWNGEGVMLRRSVPLANGRKSDRLDVWVAK